MRLDLRSFILLELLYSAVRTAMHWNDPRKLAAFWAAQGILLAAFLAGAALAMGIRALWVRGWRVWPLFAWYDLWVGVYVDVQRSRIYVLPVPCCGMVISWRTP